MANPKLKLNTNSSKDSIEIQITKDQMAEINIVREHTFSIYNFHRSVMIMLIKEIAGKQWHFSDSEPIKLEFDPNNLKVRISIDEKAESLTL